MRSKHIIETNYNERLHINHFGNKSGSLVVIVGPGMGVPQRFYRHIATFLAEAGLDVITLDYLGTGESRKVNDLRSCDLYHWGKRDLAEVISFSQMEFSDPIHFMGHSISAQILPFAENAQCIRSGYFVASQNASHTNWRGKSRITVDLFWNVIIPFSTGLFGGLPGWTYGGKEKIPKEVAKQWARWGRSKKGAPECEANGFECYRKMKFPAQFLSIEEDELMAPRKSVETIAASYANAQHIHFQQPIGHMGFFTKAHRNLWSKVIDWVMQHNEIESIR